MCILSLVLSGLLIGITNFSNTPGLSIIGVAIFALCCFLAFLYWKFDGLPAPHLHNAALVTQSIVFNIPEDKPCITTNELHEVIGWNDKAVSLYGYSRNEAIGEDLGALLMVDYGNYSSQQVIEDFKNAGRWMGRVTHYTKAGEKLAVQLTCYLQKGNEPGQDTILGVIENYQLLPLAETADSSKKVFAAEPGFFNGFFEHAKDAVFSLDQNFEFSYVNPEAEYLLGKTAEELTGKSIWAEKPYLTGEPFYFELQKCLRTQKTLLTHVFFNTSGLWLELSIFPSKNGVLIYCRNINEQKKLEIKKQEAQESLQSHLDNVRLAVVQLDADKKIIQWSASASKLFCIDDEEAAGKTLLQLNLISAEDLERLISSEQKNKRRTGVQNSVLQEVLLPTGETIMCEWFISTVQNDEFEKGGYLFIIENVSDKIALANTYRENTERILSMVENSMIGFYIIQHNKFVYVNEAFAALLGYDTATVLTFDSLYDFVVEEDKQTVQQNIAERQSGIAKAKQYSLRVKRKDGAIIVLEVFGIASEYKGNPALVGSAIAITEKVERIEKLSQENAFLKSSLQQYTLATQALQAGLWGLVVDEDQFWGNYTFFEMLSIPRNAVSSFSDFQKFFPATLLVEFRKKYQDAKACKQTFFDYDFFIDGSNHNSKYFTVKCELQYSSDGDVIAFGGVLLEKSGSKLPAA